MLRGPFSSLFQHPGTFGKILLSSECRRRPLSDNQHFFLAAFLVAFLAAFFVAAPLAAFFVATIGTSVLISACGLASTTEASIWPPVPPWHMHHNPATFVRSGVVCAFLLPILRCVDAVLLSSCTGACHAFPSVIVHHRKISITVRANFSA